MGKSIRSKEKRKHRSQFRATIGEEAAQKNMAIVQEKLKQCIAKGSMNSFERLSSMLDVTDPSGGELGAAPMAVETGISGGNDTEKMLPRKKSRKNKHLIAHAEGSTGARLTRKIITRMKARGQMKNGDLKRKSGKAKMPRAKP